MDVYVQVAQRVKAWITSLARFWDNQINCDCWCTAIPGRLAFAEDCAQMCQYSGCCQFQTNRRRSSVGEGGVQQLHQLDTDVSRRLASQDKLLTLLWMRLLYMLLCVSKNKLCSCSILKPYHFTYSVHLFFHYGAVEFTLSLITCIKIRYISVLS